MGVEETIVAVVVLLVSKVEVVVIVMVVEVVIVVVVNGTVVNIVIAAVVEAVVEAVIVELVVVNWAVILVLRVELIKIGENPEAFFKIFSKKVMFWAKEFCVKKVTQKNEMKNFMMGLSVDVNYSRF